MALNNITLRGYEFENWQFSFNLASGITAADIGKAVALDPSAPNQVKLAGDGDRIFGRLMIVEDRNQQNMLIGTVAVKFAQALPVLDGATVNVGDELVGAGGGEVKANATPTGNASIHAMEVLSNQVVALKE